MLRVSSYSLRTQLTTTCEKPCSCTVFFADTGPSMTLRYYGLLLRTDAKKLLWKPMFKVLILKISNIWFSMRWTFVKMPNTVLWYFIETEENVDTKVNMDHLQFSSYLSFMRPIMIKSQTIYNNNNNRTINYFV